MLMPTACGAGGTALGYKQQVVLPLRIVAKNADKPVTLRASVSYAVCDKTFQLYQKPPYRDHFAFAQ